MSRYLVVVKAENIILILDSALYNSTLLQKIKFYKGVDFSMDEKDYIMSDGDFLFNQAAVVEDLKDIYTTLDGSDDVSDINSIEEMVEKVAEAAESSSGGDLSTAVLTINNSNGGAEVNISVCHIVDTSETSYAVLYVDGGETVEVPIILYKGMATAIDWTESLTPSFSGNIVVSDNGYQITGDCTITYVDA